MAKPASIVLAFLEVVVKLAISGAFGAGAGLLAAGLAKYKDAPPVVVREEKQVAGRYYVDYHHYRSGSHDMIGGGAGALTGAMAALLLFFGPLARRRLFSPGCDISGHDLQTTVGMPVGFPGKDPRPPL